VRVEHRDEILCDPQSAAEWRVLIPPPKRDHRDPWTPVVGDVLRKRGARRLEEQALFFNARTEGTETKRFEKVGLVRRKNDNRRSEQDGLWTPRHNPSDHRWPYRK
jgi:hypothetical protein